MRPTRLGVYAALLAGFTLFAAGSTGNNLLYLLFASTSAALALAALAGWWNLRGVSACIENEGAAFRGSLFTASIELRNDGRLAARAVRVVGPEGATSAVDVPAGGVRRAEFRLSLPWRGLNRFDAAALESRHPFGFFILRRRVEYADLLALPGAGASAASARLEDDERASGARPVGASREGDFIGPRPHAPEDDARLIHWKLSAKSGRLVVAEHAGTATDKAVVRLEATDDASVERAALACRRWLAEGAETGLVGPGVEVAPARGPAQLERLLRALALVGDGASPRPAARVLAPRDDGPADSRALRRLTLLGGAVVYASLFLIDDLSPTWLLAFAPLLPLGAWLQERGGPFPPKALWNFFSAGMLGFLLLVDWRRSGVALANTHLLGYLLLNRLFSPWPARELRQVFLILYLAFFLVSGLTISPWYFPLFVAWNVFAGAWLMLESGADPVRPRAWLATLARLFVAGLALGAAVFVVVPRVEGLRRFNPFVASGMDQLQIRSQAVMGFTDRVTLGHFGNLRRSPARALRLHPAAPPRSAAEAPAVYVRGAAFDTFDGKAWAKPALVRSWGRRLGATILFPGPRDPSAFWDFEVYPMQVAVLFTVGVPRSIEGLGSSAWMDPTDSVRLSATMFTGARYRVYDAPSGGTYAPPDAAALARALAVPPDPGGRVAALAASWTKSAPDAGAKARAVVARLRRDYSYSTYSDGKRTGLPDFLFDVRRGNCEYFATAAAVLLRHAGVATRLVTGFRASDWNVWGKFYDVRQSQAHAWIEAWSPERREWLTYDPTPEESGFSAAADEFTRRLSRWADMLQNSWYRSVIGYDQYSQRDAFLRLTFARAFRGLSDVVESVARKLGAPLLLLLLGYWTARAAWSRRPRGDAYEKAERALARAGLRRRPEQTPQEFATEVAGARPELAELALLASSHYRRRYAGEVPGPNQRRDDARRLAAIKALL